MNKNNLKNGHFAAIHRAIMAAKFPTVRSDNSMLLFSRNLKEALVIIESELNLKNDLRIEDYPEVLTFIRSELSEINDKGLTIEKKNELVAHACYPFIYSDQTKKTLVDSL